MSIISINYILPFLYRRLSDETQSRKVSRSSTNQLIADVANGLAAHIEGPDPPNLPPGGHGSLHMGQNGGTSSSMSSGSPMAVTALASSPCSPFHNCYADVQAKPPAASNTTSHNTSHMTSFRPPIGNTFKDFGKILCPYKNSQYQIEYYPHLVGNLILTLFLYY